MARLAALIAEIVGSETRDASTLFSALWASASLGVAYMTWLDGFGYQKFGTHGLLWTDAASNLLVFAIVIAVFVAQGWGLQRGPMLEGSGQSVGRQSD